VPVYEGGVGNHRVVGRNLGVFVGEGAAKETKIGLPGSGTRKSLLEILPNPSFSFFHGGGKGWDLPVLAP